jgi:hypothetical protein
MLKSSCLVRCAADDARCRWHCSHCSQWQPLSCVLDALVSAMMRRLRSFFTVCGCWKCKALQGGSVSLCMDPSPGIVQRLTAASAMSVHVSASYILVCRILARAIRLTPRLHQTLATRFWAIMTLSTSSSAHRAGVLSGHGRVCLMSMPLPHLQTEYQVHGAQTCFSQCTHAEQRAVPMQTHCHI